MKFLKLLSPFVFNVVGGLSPILLSLFVGASPTLAAENVILKAGLLHHKIAVEDLQKLTESEDIPHSLKPYSFLLNSEVKQILSQSFNIDPLIAEQFLDDLFKSDDGKKLLKQMSQALPDSDASELKQALQLFLKQTNHLSIINFLRVYPQETVTIDVSKVALLGLKMNGSFLHSRLINSQLEKGFSNSSQTDILAKFDPTATGDQTVSIKTAVLYDRSRDRYIPLDIYTAKKTHGPLVIMSHGFASDRRFLRYLARHLASYGLTVVSVEHPGSDINALIKTATGIKLSQILPSAEFVDRPQDISFVLNRLSLINQKNPQFKGKFNTKKVSMIGHSFGGYTALALGGASLDLKSLRRFCQNKSPLGRSPADWLQCAAGELPYPQRTFKDNRIKQIIVFNPIIGELFGDNLSQIKVPTLMLSASDDGITPTIAHQLKPFKQLSTEKYMIMAMGGTHMSISDMNSMNSVMGQSTLVKEVMGIEAEPVRQLVRGVSLAFIQQLTPKKSQYKMFLTSSYIESLSQENLNFRMGKQLPTSVKTWINVMNMETPKVSLLSIQSKLAPLQNIQRYFINARQIFLQPQYSTEKLNDLFTGLLHTHDDNLDKWS
ncbi:alpha/beta hydrolase [Cyanothece sp. BG0011]|uniref:alpha/beta hydrolase n=1 Tax=Cyanothece sp. BG0011 TaxID=2082950 RepID=UPI000D1EFEDB|nr:alpha/beta hydrolase [Cyanothece sp. BG0011]